MPKNLSEVREYISRIKPWAAVAGVGAALLLAFYTLQGMEYWNAWNEARTMSDDIERISRKLEKGVPSSEEVAVDLSERQKRLEYLNRVYDYPDVARLMGIVSTTSWDTAVDLPSISAAEPTFEEIDGMRYRTQALSLTARGAVPDIYRFLATLHQKVKVVSAPNVQLSNPSDEEAMAQIQLTFYLSPQPISEEEGAD